MDSSLMAMLRLLEKKKRESNYECMSLDFYTTLIYYKNGIKDVRYRQKTDRQICRSSFILKLLSPLFPFTTTEYTTKDRGGLWNNNVTRTFFTGIFFFFFFFFFFYLVSFPTWKSKVK